jgi:hypothetical protein
MSEQQHMHPHSSPQSSPRHSVSGPAGVPQPDVVAQLQAQVMQLHQQQQQQQQQLQAAQQAAMQAQAQAHGAAAGSQSTPSLPKIRAPSQFKGEMGFAVDDWICELEQQFAYYNRAFPDDASRIKFAVAYLHGPAVHWWDKEPAKAIVGLTWAEFLATLRKRYRPVQASMLARQRLDKLRQRTGQTVNAYANQFQMTLQPIADMSAADQVHHFVNGLLHNVAAKVWERHPLTLPTAIDYAVSVEAMSNFGRAAMPSGFGFANRSSASHTAASSGSVPMDINHIGHEEQDDQNAEIEPPRIHEEPSSADSALIAVLNRMDARVEAMEHRVLALAGGSQGRSASSAPRRDDNRVPGLKAGEIDQLRREKRCFRCKGTGHFKTDPKCPKFPKSAPRSVNW